MRNVWLSSILIGAILVLVIGGVTSKQRRDRVPTSHDSPVSVLKKIAKNGLSILLTEVRFKFNNLDLHGFVIERIDDGQRPCQKGDAGQRGEHDERQDPAALRAGSARRRRSSVSDA